MDLKKFTEAQKINEEIVSINEQLKVWSEAIRFNVKDVEVSTKTDAKLIIKINGDIFDSVKKLEVEKLQTKLKELQTKFNAI